MDIIKRLFGRKDRPEPPARDMAKLLAPFSKPAVQLLKSADRTQSFFGGTPPLAVEAQWPSKDGRPLAFLACIDLESLGKAFPAPWLPSYGRLLYFYDAENQPWGFDPKHRGGWAVMHAGDEATPRSVAARAPSLPLHYLSFHPMSTYPSVERPEVEALQPSDAEVDDLVDASGASYGESPRHQIGGLPSTVQGDQMELECQLVSHGIYCGDPSGYSGPEADDLRSGAADWRLLLQMDSDDDLDIMWGDAGILYFWIREQDALAGRFDKSWVVLQCH